MLQEDSTYLIQKLLNNLKEIISSTVDEKIQSAFAKLYQPPIEKPVDDLITKKQAAAYLKVSLPSLSKYVKLGLIPCHRLSKSSLRFKISELEKSLSVTRNNRHSRYIKPP